MKIHQTISMDIELKERMDEYCKENNVKISTFISEFIKDFLDTKNDLGWDDYESDDEHITQYELDKSKYDDM